MGLGSHWRHDRLDASEQKEWRARRVEVVKHLKKLSAQVSPCLTLTPILLLHPRSPPAPTLSLLPHPHSHPDRLQAKSATEKANALTESTGAHVNSWLNVSLGVGREPLAEPLKLYGAIHRAQPIHSEDVAGFKHRCKCPRCYKFAIYLPCGLKILATGGWVDATGHLARQLSAF